jgi:molecular chaperone HtpG
MRRMKEMSQLGGGMGFYGDLPDSYNLVVNGRHNLIEKLSEDITESLGIKLTDNDSERTRLKEEIDFMEKEQKKKKEDEISQFEKDDLVKLRGELDNVTNARKDLLEGYGNENKIVKQLIDLALLANNMLRGEDLSQFVKRSVELL